MNAAEMSSRPACEEPVVRLVAFGDVGLAGALDLRIQRGDGDEILVPVRDLLMEADLRIGNFEFPVKPPAIDAKRLIRGGRFLVDARAPEVFRGLGATVYSLANNHTMDAGLEGIRATQKALTGIGATTVGAGATVAEARAGRILDCNGLKIGVLAGCKKGDWSVGSSRPGAADLELSAMAEEIRSLKAAGADVVVVACHWGVEFCSYPGPDQIRLGRGLVEAGAALVLGHHPHTLQGLERWGNGLIVYSLGNFVMDMGWDRPPTCEALEHALETALLRVKLGKSGVVEHEWIPLRSVEGAPRPLAEPDEVDRSARRFDELCRDIGSNRYQQTAFKNLWRRELGAWTDRIRAEGWRGVARLARAIKLRHFGLLCGHLWRKIFGR